MKKSQHDKIPLPNSTLIQVAKHIPNIVSALKQANISPSILAYQNVTVSTQQYFAFWQAVDEQSDDPLLGLHLDGGHHYAICDPATLVMLHSANFQQALARLVRYKRLVCPQIVQIEQTEQEIAITSHWSTSKQAEPNLVTDLFFASLVHILQLSLPEPVKPLRLNLTRPTLAKGYADYFGCEIRLNAPRNEIVFSQQVAELPFQHHNPDLLNVLLPNLETELNQFCESSFKQQIKREIYHAFNGKKPSLEEVAKQLFLSTRTLQRRLQEAKLSFQQLLNETRLEVAEQLLKHSEMAIAEIAFYLGYQEVTSFNRAFTQWQGISPTQYRKEQHNANDNN